MSGLLVVFTTVFLAELGDKTQIATLLFATRDEHSPVLVFLATAAALTVSSALAVGTGVLAARYLDMIPLRLISGLIFVVLGTWSIVEHFRGA